MEESQDDAGKVRDNSALRVSVRNGETYFKLSRDAAVRSTIIDDFKNRPCGRGTTNISQRRDILTNGLRSTLTLYMI